MSADTLRRAAALIRTETPSGGDDFRDFLRAVSDWLDSEADNFEVFATKAAAINFLLDVADEQIEARVGIGYNTLDKALAAARAYLGETK